MTVMTVTKFQSEVTEELVYYEHNCINGRHTEVKNGLRTAPTGEARVEAHK